MLGELCDGFRKCKRVLDSYFSLRRAFLCAVLVLGLLMYVGPSLFRWLRKKTPIMIDPAIGCVASNMHSLVQEAEVFDASVQRSYEGDEHSFLTYVGNGKIGLPLDGEEQLYIFNKRSLSLAINYHPLVQVDIPGASQQQGFAVQYKTGIAYKFQCFNMRRHSVSVIQQIYAYRITPSILIQQIDITNPLNEDLTLILRQESSSTSENTPLVITLPNGNRFEYKVFSEEVRVPGSRDTVVLSIAAAKVPSSVTLTPKSSKKLVIRTSVHYSEPSAVPKAESLRQKLESEAQMDLRNALDSDPLYLRMKHVESWKKVWQSGFSISYSKAQNALNGDRINATLYFLLSQSRDFLHEGDLSFSRREELSRSLHTPDRCYGGHHTLQASTLWSDLRTISDVNRVVDLWFLTLNKQGCHNLLMAGAEGVMQGALLSMGAFQFRRQHLELVAHPRDLHRELCWHGLAHGNVTRLAVAVALDEENHARLSVWLEKADREYYACDGGCLDPPVKLGLEPMLLPVKLTSPVTAILYVTSDRQHIEELKHTIHVKEVAKAPAHEHHVLAMHRHGHPLGGLPAFFWVSVAFLIAVFHLFLAKLVYNEYCGGGQEKTRARYLV